MECPFVLSDGVRGTRDHHDDRHGNDDFLVRREIPGLSVRREIPGLSVRREIPGLPVRRGNPGFLAHRCCFRCPDSGWRHCGHNRKLSLARSRRRRNKRDRWRESRTWRCSRPRKHTRLPSPRTRRLCRCSSRDWRHRSCRRTRCWRGRSRQRHRTSHQRPHSRRWTRCALSPARKARLKQRQSSR